MTRKEAIKWLTNIKDKFIHGGDEAFDNARREALDMAIKALEQEPCKDLLDLCIIFAHQIEDQEQTIEELRTELKIAENDYKKCYAENIRLAEKIRENII